MWTLSDKLQRAQNNSLHAILRVDPQYSTSAFHVKTGIHSLDAIRYKSTCLQVFKCVKGYNSPAMNALFNTRNTTRLLRSSDDIILDCPLTKTKLRDNNIAVRGPKYWSKLDYKTKHSNTLAQFERNLKISSVNHPH